MESRGSRVTATSTTPDISWVAIVVLELHEGVKEPISPGPGAEEPSHLRDPEISARAMLIIESTYGSRTRPVERVEERLALLIHRIFARKGKIIISLSRWGGPGAGLALATTAVHQIPGCCVYVDSPPP
jgi:hypothetical protein